MGTDDPHTPTPHDSGDGAAPPVRFLSSLASLAETWASCVQILMTGVVPLGMALERGDIAEAKLVYEVLSRENGRQVATMGQLLELSRAQFELLETLANVPTEGGSHGHC